MITSVSLKLAWTELPSLTNLAVVTLFLNQLALKQINSIQLNWYFFIIILSKFGEQSLYWKEVVTFFQSYAILMWHQHLLD